MRDSTNEVLRAIAINGPISRAQLARDLGLSGPTLTQSTKYLIDRRLIHELEQTPSTGGRPATLLGLVAGAGQIIGVKLAPDHLVGVCVNLDSEIQWGFEEAFTSRGDLAVEELIKILKKQTKRVKSQLLGIGIGLPGVVSSDNSGTVDSTMLGWSRLNVGKKLSQALSTPVLLENDVNTLAIAESLYGRTRDISNFLTVTLGRGVGLGLVINGELYAGSYGAGEIGHVASVKNGKLCECGKRGCLETIASDPAILASAIESGLVKKSATMRELWKAARSDKPLAEKVFREPAEALGLALANVVNVFGPEIILVSGAGSEGWDLWSPWFSVALKENVVSTMDHFEIEIDPWDDAKWALGASALVLQASLSHSSLNSSTYQEVKDRLRLVTRQSS